MNAILQILLHTPLLRNYLKNGQFLANINPVVKNISIIESLGKFLDFYHKHSDVTSMLRKLKSCIGKILPIFKQTDQHDAQEFFCSLIDRLNFEISGNPLEKANNISVIDALFLGKITTIITCQNCNNISKNNESFYNLSLPIPEKVYFLIIIPKKERNNIKNKNY